MIKVDNPTPPNLYKLPSIENKSDCFEKLKEIFDTSQSNGEWYHYPSSIKKEYDKCLRALEAENIIDLKGYGDFKFKDAGYEIYNTESYIDYTIKKNILYFIVDAMKDQDGISTDILLQKIKSCKTFDPASLVTNTAIVQATQQLFKAISSHID